MGVPGADVRYVLETLVAIEAAIHDQTCNHQELGLHCTPECPPSHGIALTLLRELKAELEAMT